VLIDAPGIGRSHREAPEIDGVIRVPNDLKVGTLVEVEIVDAEGADCIALPADIARRVDIARPVDIARSVDAPWGLSVGPASAGPLFQRPLGTIS
jgi:hypothetical protein